MVSSVAKTAHGRDRSQDRLPDRAKIRAARARLALAGQSITAWASENGEPLALVYKVLGGSRPCDKGAALRIAVKLGIKDRASVPVFKAILPQAHRDHLP